MTHSGTTCDYQTCGRPQSWLGGRWREPAICLALQSGTGPCARTRWNPEGSKALQDKGRRAKR